MLKDKRKHSEKHSFYYLIKRNKSYFEIHDKFQKGFQCTRPSEGKQNTEQALLSIHWETCWMNMTLSPHQYWEPLTVRAMHFGSSQKIGYDMVDLRWPHSLAICCPSSLPALRLSQVFQAALWNEQAEIHLQLFFLGKDRTFMCHAVDVEQNSSSG